MEVLPNEILIPAVSKCVVKKDEIIDQEMQQAVVNGMHAILGTDLDQAWHLGKATVTNTAAHGAIEGEDLGGEHAPGFICARQEVLADDAAQAVGELGGDVVLLLVGEGVKNACHRGGSIGGVQS